MYIEIIRWSVLIGLGFCVFVYIVIILDLLKRWRQEDKDLQWQSFMQYLEENAQSNKGNNSVS